MLTSPELLSGLCGLLCHMSVNPGPVILIKPAGMIDGEANNKHPIIAINMGAETVPDGGCTERGIYQPQ